ncbi:hypothetical protein SUGI_0643200 [Cryptomeria japonica]|uniref:vegetative cell wall protein gp1 n=1 Tax=Cryptomeria japonica TaxID=3369 RepID=UPI0024147B33|nr:vegetative cell wall protein gp1 [Cryptomeria japonica]GLJ31952.1 hypothetical protein SUGI_0643200 [Cryptomeria japonica]
MAPSRVKVFLFGAIACLYASFCLSENPQKEETVFSVGHSSDKNPFSRASFLSRVSNLMWTNTEKTYEDPVIQMFGEGDENEKIDLLLPGQELNGEQASSFWAAKPPLEQYTPTQSPSSTSPSLAPPSPVPNLPPLVAPTPSSSAQSPSPLPPSASIAPTVPLSPSISPSSTHAPSPTSFPPSTAPSSTPYPFPPSPITPSPYLPPPIFPPSVSPTINPPSILPPILPPPIFPPSVSPPINPPSVLPPIFPPFPSMSPPTFPPSASPSPHVSPPILPPFSSPSPSLPPPIFPPLPPQPPSQSPSPSSSPTPSPVPTSLSPSPTPSVTPPQPSPLPTPTPSPFPTPSSPIPSPSPSPTPSSPTASPPTPIPSPVPTPSKISILTNLIVLNGASLVPDFNPFVFSYKVSFDPNVRRFLVVAYLPEDDEDYKNLLLHIESVPLKSGEKSPPLKLGKRGETVTFHIYVRAVNHAPTTYVLSVTREAGYEGLGTVAIIFVVLACIVGALILMVLGYAAYFYARTGRMPQLRDFPFFRGRHSSLYTPLIASGVTNDDDRL